MTGFVITQKTFLSKCNYFCTNNAAQTLNVIIIIKQKPACPLFSELFFNDCAFLCLAADGFDRSLVGQQTCPLSAEADTVDEVDG